MLRIDSRVWRTRSLATNVPQPIQPVLHEYLRLVHDALPELLVGLYLHGSLALDAFIPGLSDIDFIAITSRRCSMSDINALRAVHQSLTQRYPETPLEGSYLQWPDLGRLEAVVPPHPHIHGGILHPSGYHDINGVTWWILKYRGIAVIGPPPDHLDIDVDLDDLVVKMRHNLNTYWAGFTTHPRRMAWLLDDYGIQWTVLGVLRQFYTFREYAITSKIGAGAYAVKHVPCHWHRLIHEAINIRTGGHPSLYRSSILRAVMARAFLQLIITACNPNAA